MRLSSGSAPGSLNFDREPFTKMPLSSVSIDSVSSVASRRIADVRATGESIAELQLPSGQIPWFPGGHCDPWNHVETAMALDVCGLHDEARLAYQWLVDIQHDDGSWYQYYIGDDVEQHKFDANPIAYIAVGVWHRWLLHGDRSWLEYMWPVVDKAINWVLELQRPAGDIASTKRSKR